MDYFERHDHQVVRSSPLVPVGDPTLLFTNAGMVQFKGVFTGAEQRDYRRAASSQKCLRVSGKHNDLERVGFTARHHTFFEMLGNFSFGDYFKEEAIELGWGFLVDEMGIPAKNLWVSVFEKDDEAFRLWSEKMGVPEGRILRRGEKDNYWSMGETGPCGPCSEILLDLEPSSSPPSEEDLESDRFLEIWNLVFMQFVRSEDGKQNPLPKPSIDTGMGLERLCTVLQGVTSNFHTDLLLPLIRFTEGFTEKRYDLQKDFYDRVHMSFRVIADHVRAIAFLVADGVLPSNEGRGYVLRRILRRAARHGRLLGIGDPFLYRAVEEVTNLMKDFYPELRDALTYISRVTLAEEERFVHALDQGLPILSDLIAGGKEKGTIDGKALFKLYDTHGFPLDLAEDAAAEGGLSLDLDGFNEAMEEQRVRARASWKGFGEGVVSPAHQALKKDFSPVHFVGYEKPSCQAKVLALVKGEKPAKEAAQGEEAEILLDQTPFYAEAGGQVGDQGVLEGEKVRFLVEDCQAPMPGYRLHRGRVEQGILRVGDEVEARVDQERRGRTVLNHTATHLLHAALREILGDHVKQAGSLVAPDRLRFDYTHFSPLKPGERQRLEERVNEHVRQDAPVTWKQRKLEEALAEGAMALFGEKYEERVRVVSVEGVSKELCGGTHTRASGKIGLFKIVHEGSVAAGVRRIEAVTGSGALAHVRQEESAFQQVGDLLKVSPLKAPEKLKKLMAEERELKREIQKLRQRLDLGLTEDLLAKVKELDGVPVLVTRVEESDPKGMRGLIDTFKGKIRSGIVVLGAIDKEKAILSAGVTKDLTGRFHAGEILKASVAVVGGTGGGRPDFAQAGGKEASKLDEALDKALEVIQHTIQQTS